MLNRFLNGIAYHTQSHYSASFMVNNGIAGSMSVSEFRSSASANNLISSRNSPQDVTPTSHAADADSGHEAEFKILSQQLAETEAENRKLKADEAARKAAAAKMRYTIVYNKHENQVIFQLNAFQNWPMVSSKGDAVYCGCDAGFGVKVEPSVYAVIKLLDTNAGAVAPPPPPAPLVVATAQEEGANHLRVSRAEKAGGCTRARRSSSFSGLFSLRKLKSGGDDELKHKTKTVEENSNPFFTVEAMSISMLPATLTEGKCILSIEAMHSRLSGILHREKKLLLGKALIALNAESVKSSEQTIVEHECELHR